MGDRDGVAVLARRVAQEIFNPVMQFLSGFAAWRTKTGGQPGLGESILAVSCQNFERLTASTSFPRPRSLLATWATGEYFPPARPSV